MNLIAAYLSQIKELCDANSVKSLFVFGSAITDRFRDSSDIDLIVEIEEEDPTVYSEHYFNLKFQLEKLLKRKIDLLEKKSLSNTNLVQEIEENKVLVYEKRN